MSRGYLFASCTGHQCNWVFFVSVAVPYQAPNKLSLTAQTSTSVIASWQPPSKTNITGYKLFYRKQGSQDSLTTLTTDRSAATVTNLTKYTEYEFQVLAFNYFGAGPKSPFKVVRTKEDGKRFEHCLR